MAYSPVLGNPKPQYFDSNGDPYVSMRLFFYAVGTSTKQATQTDSTGTTDNTNPVVFDANGFPTGDVMIYGSNNLGYKVVAAPPGSDDPPTSPLWTIDNIYPGITVNGEWVNPTDVVYASATTFTVSGLDVTELFSDKRPIKLTGGADRYGVVESSTFATDTTVTVTDITDNTGTAASLHVSMDSAYVSVLSVGATSALPNQDNFISVTDYLSGAEWVDVKERNETLDHSAALLAAYTATPTGGTLWFDDGTYMWDFQLVVAKSIHFRGSGAATIKLPNQSTLFHLADATRRPYMMYVQESGFSMEGLVWDGNSVNNYKDIGGTNHYNYTASPIYSCGLVLIGWGEYFASGNKDINNIHIRKCSFIDSPHTGIDTLNSSYSITNYTVVDNYFEKCQDDQCSMSNVFGGVIADNVHTQPYNHGIHAYYDCDNINIHDNSIFFDSTLLTSSIVEYYILNTTWVAFGIKLGKQQTQPVNNINVHDNNLNGCGIEMIQGVNYCNVHDNEIINVQDAATGIAYQVSYATLGDSSTQYDITNPSGNIVRYTYNGTGTNPSITSTTPPSGSRIFTSGGSLATPNSGYFDVYSTGTNYIEVINATHTVESGKTTTIRWAKGLGNKIHHNIIANCYNPGLYLSDNYQDVEVTDNILIGNNTSTAQYGSRDCFANIFIIAPFFMIERNVCRRLGAAPSYAINFYTGTTVTARINDGSAARQVNHLQDNQILNGGYVADFYDVDGNHRGNPDFTPRYTLTTDKNFNLHGKLGDVKIFTYQNDSIADDGTVSLPDSTSGMVFVSCNAESAMFLVQNDGSVIKVAGTTLTTATNTDTYLCCFDNGTYARVDNRLGTTGEIRIIYYYN